MTALLHDFSTSRLLDFPLQIAPPSNTWFTRSPEWGWFIVVYFFLGGIAGGAAFLSGLLDLLGNRLDRRMTRIGYLIALVAIVIGGPLLIIDLTRPERFWHMVWMSETGGPMFKPYSAISLGIWIIMAFVIFVVLAISPPWPTRGRKSEVGSRPVAMDHLPTHQLTGLPTRSSARSSPWAASLPVRRWPDIPVSS